MNFLLINVNTGIGWGGIESHSDILAATLAGRGHKVILGCGVEGSVTVGNGTVLTARKIRIRNSGDIRAVIRMVRICRREDIDILIANGGREYWPSALAAILLGKRTVFIRHQTDPIRKTTRWLINNHVASVVAVSGAVRQALVGSKIRTDKITLIHNAIQLSRFDPYRIDRGAVRRELGISENESLIGTVAKLTRGKGVYELMRAVGTLSKKHGSVRLVFVGDGEERDGLQRESERLGIKDRVIFTGVRKDVERMYAAMDIFVLPSICEEAFGMVLI